MSPKALKIALAVSVALNVFAIAGGASLWNTLKHEEAQVITSDERREARERPGSPMTVIASLSPEGRELMREGLRAKALAVRPDFEQARARRRDAIAAATADPYDAARVTALLEQSRAAERRGRDRLEAETVNLLGRLSAEDRRVASDLLNRRGRGGLDRRGGADGAHRRGDQAA